jgi:lysyl-tRNA synthetase class 2
MDGPSPWWHPELFDRRLAPLRLRARLKDETRQFFRTRAYLEVDAPILQRSPGNETHIAAFATELYDPDGARHRLYLHTSPEMTCKMLLAAGLDRLFTLGPVFRNRERGRLHHPEFTMLEWYAAGQSLDHLIADCSDLLRMAARAADLSAFTYRGQRSDPFAEPDEVTVSDAFRRYAQIDLDRYLPSEPDALSRFAEAARQLGLRVADDDTWSDLFSKILTAFIEPQLGQGRPTFLTRYPASEAALARLCPDDPRFADRFELYVCGVELANAFAELRDPQEQRRRFAAAEAERSRIYGEAYPLDEDFLAALAFVPEAVGIALGFDRLVMLAAGADTIETILWAPVAASGAEAAA